MQEYVSEAIVLSVAPFKEYDGRFSLFTKRFGKLIAKGTSVRKPKSKLVGHLQPGHYSRVRLVERHGLHVVDAVKERAVEVSAPNFFFLDQLLPEAVPDLDVWNLLAEDRFSWHRALRILGWDPIHAICGTCERGLPYVFNVRNQEFFCSICASKVRQDEVLYLT